MASSSEKKYLKGHKVIENQCLGAQPGRVAIYCFKQSEGKWICPDPSNIELIDFYQQKLKIGYIDQFKIVYVKRIFYNNPKNWSLSE